MKTAVALMSLAFMTGAAALNLSMEALPHINVRVGHCIIDAKVARSDAEQEQGLSGVERLGRHEGMLFMGQADSTAGFWMKGTSLPLSIAFLDDSGQVNELRDLTPFDLRAVAPREPYRHALELNRGMFAACGISVGERVIIS